MKELGFKHLVSDADIFIFRDENGGMVMVIVYIDDTLFCEQNKVVNKIEVKEFLWRLPGESASVIIIVLVCAEGVVDPRCLVQEVLREQDLPVDLLQTCLDVLA